MRKSVILFFVLVTLSFFSFGQSGDWYMNKPVVDITFEGLQNVKPSDLEGLKVQVLGRNFDENLFLDLQSRLYALNYFESFEASAIPGDENNSTVILHFVVLERPLVDKIIFRGNANLRNRALEEVVISKSDDILNRSRIRMDADAIKGLYIAEGFPDVQVTGLVETQEDSGKVTIVFEIEEGSQTRVKEILFSGNSFASSSTLKRLLSTKQQSLFNAGTFEEGKLQADRKALLDYYHQRGYVDAVILDVTKDGETDEEGNNLLTLTFYIEEGVQYTFGGISFEGNTLFSQSELQGSVRSEVGKILNKSRLEADLMRVGDVYYNDGYIFNQIIPEELRDREKRTISYVIHIREESRAHIENITIKGNVKTRDYVILREIPLEVGDVFSKEKIMTGLNNLANLRFFETFVPETPQGSAQGLMDLVINVEEGRTTDINFGVTFTMEAGQFPLLGFITWTDRNLRGTGRQLSIGSEVSGTQQNLNFSFKDDWLFGRRWSGGIDFSIKHRLIEGALQDVLAPVFFGSRDENPQMVPDPFSGEWVNPDTGKPATAEEIAAGTAVTDYAYAIANGQSIDSSYLMDYETYEFSLGGSTGYSWHTNYGRIGTGTGLSTALSYTTYDDDIYRPYNPDIRNELGLWSFINRWWGRISFDTRDIVYSPNKGVFLSQSLSYTGGVLGGSRHYNKLTTIGEVFFKLLEVPVTDAWNFKTVLALHSNLSVVLPQWHVNSDGDWVKETVATTSDLLYTDGMITAKGWPVQQDGKVMWDNWAELRMPIIAGYISFNHFFSATALYNDTSEMKDIGFDDFRYGFGSGLQIDLPTFPMGFYFVKRFSVADDKIQWQPGNAFRRADDPTSGLDFVISFSFSYF